MCRRPRNAVNAKSAITKTNAFEHQPAEPVNVGQALPREADWKCLQVVVCVDPSCTDNTWVARDREYSPFDLCVTRLCFVSRGVVAVWRKAFMLIFR